MCIELFLLARSKESVVVVLVEVSGTPDAAAAPPAAGAATLSDVCHDQREIVLLDDFIT